jgi:hypothetical protein
MKIQFLLTILSYNNSLFIVRVVQNQQKNILTEQVVPAVIANTVF